MKPLTPFKQGFLGGLASLLLVALLIAAGAVLAQEPYDPNKDIDVNGIIDVVDIQEVAASWNTSGSPRGTLVVFGTTASYTGNPSTAYGRRGMHEACRLEDPNSHFCSIQEIENAWMTTGVTFMTHGALWVDNAVLGSLAAGYDGNWLGASDWYGGGSSNTDYPLNCAGWTTNSHEAWGYSVNTGAIAPSPHRSVAVTTPIPSRVASEPGRGEAQPRAGLLPVCWAASAALRRKNSGPVLLPQRLS